MSGQSTKLEETPRKRKLLVGLFVTFLMMIVVALAYTVHSVFATVKLMQTHNDFKWVVMALHRYHDKHSRFPPAVEFDEQGVPMHSWRTIIEPYLETSDSHFRLSSYDFKQRWNSEANQNSIHQHRFGDYSFQLLAVVGPHAAWGADGPHEMKDFKDGTSNTVMVIGIRNSGIAWNEPQDAVFDGQDILVQGRPLEANQRIFALFADGTVRYGVYRHDMAPLFTIDADDTVPEW